MRKISISMAAAAILAIALAGCGTEESADSRPEQINESATLSDQPSAAVKTLRPIRDSLDRTRIPREEKNIRKVELGGANWPDGTIRVKTTPLDDKQAGLSKIETFYMDGSRETEGEYLNSKKHGYFLRWNQNGALAMAASFDQGTPVDELKLYWPNGNLKQVTVYSDGEIGGRREEYLEDGPIKRRVYYDGGAMTGPTFMYHRNGVIEYRGWYKDGSMSGVWEKFYPNGRLKARSFYKDGKKHGPSEVWERDGVAMPAQYFERGVRTTKESSG